MSLREMSLTEQKNQNNAGDDVYDDGYLRVEHKNYYVACAGTPLKLPRTEFGDKPLNTESLHVYIYRLRAKLHVFGLQIETMVNVGYRLLTSPQH